MESLKNISIEGLRELRKKGLRSLKISDLKNLVVKPEESRTEHMSDTGLEDLAQKREEIKIEIKKLNQKKKGIETRIHLIQKTEKEKCEEIMEFPWRDEIFPPLPRKLYVKMPETVKVVDSSSHEENSEISETKDNEMKINEKGVNEMPEDGRLDEKTPEKAASRVVQSAFPAVQNTTINNTEVTCPKIEIEEKEEEKTSQKKEDETKTVYPFSAEKPKENKILNKNLNKSLVEVEKTESKKNTAANLLGESLIEELLNSDDLNPEDEQGFMKYLQEPEMGELIKELKDTRSLLARERHAG